MKVYSEWYENDIPGIFLILFHPRFLNELVPGLSRKRDRPLRVGFAILWTCYLTGCVLKEIEPPAEPTTGAVRLDDGAFAVKRRNEEMKKHER